MGHRFARTCVAGLLAGTALFGADIADAAPPPDGETEEVLERFAELAERSGVTAIDPACAPSTSDPGRTFTCYARTADGGPFIALVTLAAGGVVEYEIVAAPGEQPDAAAPTGGEEDDGDDFDPLVYFLTLFSGDPERIATLRGQTGPGTPAEAYVLYQLAFARTITSFGGELEPSHVYLSSDGVVLCVTEDVCVPVTDLEVVDDQLVDFSVDGEQIAPRLGRPGDTLTAGPASVRVNAAYRAVTGADALRVYVELSADSDAIFELSKAVYVGSDGELTPVDPDTSIGAVDGTTRDLIIVALDFPRADPGGELRFLLFPRGRDPLPVILPVAAVTEPAPSSDG